MHPVLIRIAGLEIPTHEAFVALGVGAALAVFWYESRRRGNAAHLWPIAAGALIGGAVFAKAATAWRYVAATGDATVQGILVHGGKSIIGGLAGAYFGALLAKRLTGYRQSTGDTFAPAVALGIAVGRIGCFLTEQIGTTTAMPWGITPPAAVAAQIPNCPQCLLGVPLHPSFLYEIAFCLAAFVALVAIRDRIPVAGDPFKAFLLGYGLFRFGVEFVRGNDVLALGLTGTQLFLAMTMPFLIAYFGRQVLRGAYRSVPRQEPAEVSP